MTEVLQRNIVFIWMYVTPKLALQNYNVNVITILQINFAVGTY